MDRQMAQGDAQLRERIRAALAGEKLARRGQDIGVQQAGLDREQQAGMQSERLDFTREENIRALEAEFEQLGMKEEAANARQTAAQEFQRPFMEREAATSERKATAAERESEANTKLAERRVQLAVDQDSRQARIDELNEEIKKNEFLGMPSADEQKERRELELETARARKEEAQLKLEMAKASFKERALPTFFDAAAKAGLTDADTREVLESLRDRKPVDPDLLLQLSKVPGAEDHLLKMAGVYAVYGQVEQQAAELEQTKAQTGKTAADTEQTQVQTEIYKGALKPKPATGTPDATLPKAEQDFVARLKDDVQRVELRPLARQSYDAVLDAYELRGTLRGSTDKTSQDRLKKLDKLIEDFKKLEAGGLKETFSGSSTFADSDAFNAWWKQKEALGLGL
jgi:hypothetical protein